MVDRGSLSTCLFVELIQCRRRQAQSSSFKDLSISHSSTLISSLIIASVGAETEMQKICFWLLQFSHFQTWYKCDSLTSVSVKACGAFVESNVESHGTTAGFSGLADIFPLSGVV